MAHRREHRSNFHAPPLLCLLRGSGTVPKPDGAILTAPQVPPDGRGRVIRGQKKKQMHEHLLFLR
ncbi:hypothetical protein F504_2433 [Ralstonia pseudosolanacearum FQY_4]|nr:hypothetical protein F504_2433 [Ralstonia pseudosolanacearum FQY_4]